MRLLCKGVEGLVEGDVHCGEVGLGEVVVLLCRERVRGGGGRGRGHTCHKSGSVEGRQRNDDERTKHRMLISSPPEEK